MKTLEETLAEIKLLECNFNKEDKNKLQDYYDFSPWYSGRYEAGTALKVDKKELNDNVSIWLTRLKDRLWLAKTEMVKAGEKPIKVWADYHDGPLEQDAIETYYEERAVPENIKSRENARKDLIGLYSFSGDPEARKILKGIANSKWKFIFDSLGLSPNAGHLNSKDYSDKEEIRKAGEALDYSPLSILINLHPISTIAAAGAISSGLGYFIYSSLLPNILVIFIHYCFYR